MPDQPHGDASQGDSDLARRIGEPTVVQRFLEQTPLLTFATEGADHRFVAATGAYVAYTGRQHLIGAPVREAFAEVLGQQVFPILDRVFETGQPEFLRDSGRGWNVRTPGLRSSSSSTSTSIRASGRVGRSLG